MTANRLTCANCGTTLTVSAAAPKVVTCPRCLYRLANPFGGQAETAIPAPVLPMKVLPLETQAAGDAGLTQTILIVLVVMLAIGAFVTASTIGVGNSAFGFLLVLLLMTFTAAVIIAANRTQRSKPVGAAIEHSPPSATAVPGILGYQNPYEREPTNALPAVGGFFAAIAVCGGGFFVLAATVDMKGQNAGRGNRAFVLTLVVATVVGFMIAAPMLSSRKGWRGFGTGATIGLALGLLALGPCAFCYLLSLG